MASDKSRWMSIGKALGGYVVGRTAVRVTTGQLDPGRMEDVPEAERSIVKGGLLGGGGSLIDDAVVVGGSAWAARTAVKGHKHADFFVGLAMGLGTPVLDSVVDRITNALEEKVAALTADD